MFERAVSTRSHLVNLILIVPMRIMPIRGILITVVLKYLVYDINEGSDLSDMWLHVSPSPCLTRQLFKHDPDLPVQIIQGCTYREISRSHGRRISSVRCVKTRVSLPATLEVLEVRHTVFEGGHSRSYILIASQKEIDTPDEQSHGLRKQWNAL